MPQLVILAGPNGSGKTTLVQSGGLDRWLEAEIIRLNADDVARHLAGGQHPSPEQSLVAAQMTDDHLDTCLSDGKSVLMETVLSSD